MKWEYRVVTVEMFFHHMMEIGTEMWEMVAVHNGMVYFKRPLEDDRTQGIPNSRNETEILMTDLSKRNDPTSQKAANFIRNTIGIANTIENTGWHFEQGSDLIKDILYPQFVEPEND